MKDEIKEILDRMQELVKHKYDKKIQTYNLFDDIQCLLDCITNLQEENKILKEDIRKDEVYFKTFELAEECDQKQDIIDDYKSRIDKAIDKLYCYGEVFDGKILQQFQKEMLNILQGSDK